jgi:hypothetical protein
MRSFTLIFDPDEFGYQKRIEFDGPDPAHVFPLLEREEIGRLATIWEGEKRLASVRRTQSGAWHINPSRQGASGTNGSGGASA